jgi:hypothetical protein
MKYKVILFSAWIAFMSVATHGQQKQTPITDKDERRELLEALGKYRDDYGELLKKQQELQDNINNSKLGKERKDLVDKLAAKDAEIKGSTYGKEKDEIDQKAKKMNEDIQALVSKHLEAHGAKGCGLTDGLNIINCPVDKK